MTVADLIAELQRMPQGKLVKVLLSGVYLSGEDEDVYEQLLYDGDAVEADEVRDEGAYVLIRSK